MTAGLLRLMSWLSPVFPTGGFAYSGGLEQAVAEGAVRDRTGLEHWLTHLLAHGSPKNDAILFAAAWRSAADKPQLEQLSGLALALAGSAERHAETQKQGASFLAAARVWFEEAALPDKAPLPVAIGAAAGRGDIALEPALSAYLHAWLSNQLQAAIRLSVTGQQGAAHMLAAFEDKLAQAAALAARSTLDDLGGFAMLADIASMNHETLQPRLFLS